MESKQQKYRIEDFKDNGFAGPIPILSSSEAENVLKTVDEEFRLTQSKQANSNLQGNHRFKIHLFLPEVSRIVHHPSVVEAVRKALDTPHILLWSSDLNVKWPQTKNFFSAHQDATYTGLEPADRCLTVWIALSNPVGVREGCLEFLKESHQWGQLSHVEDVNRDNMLSRAQRVDLSKKSIDYSRQNWVPIPLRAGEATLHHFYTIHQSGANQHPTQPRVGLALRYMAADVRQTGAIRESVTWIDALGHPDNGTKRRQVEQWFDLEPRLPECTASADIEAGRRAHEDAMDRESQNYFHDSTRTKSYS